MSESTKKFLTPDELADRWSVSRKTIYRQITEGKLPFATRIASVWRFSIIAVEKYEKSQSVGTR